MKYVLVYALEVAIVVTGSLWWIRAAGVVLMILTSYHWLRRGDHIGR